MRGYLAQREQELAHITHIRASQTIAGGAIPDLSQTNSNATVGVAGPLPPEMAQRFETMTIKQLVIQALLDHLKMGGNAALICDFIRDAYKRTIEPIKLATAATSPQGR